MSSWKCNICKHLFILNDKKLNGNYYKTCKTCRTKKIETNIETKCSSCHKIFKHASLKKTCPTCLAKKNDYGYCIKCHILFPYEKDKIACDKCSKSIIVYKDQLLRESEQYRSKVLDSDDYNDKIRFIETQIRYLYYCNDIKTTNTMYSNEQDLFNKIDNKNGWQNAVLYFKRPLNIDIKYIEKQ